MYKQLILASTLGWSLALSPSAMAKPEPTTSFESRHGVQAERDDRRDNRRDDHREDDRRDARRDDNNNWRGETHRDNRQHYDNRRREDHRRDDRRDARDDRGHDNRPNHGRYHNDDRHPHYDRHRSDAHDRSNRYGHARWRRGERMPDHYRTHRYVVHDYHAHRLYSPPRGHHWVRVDNDFVLTAVATGVIAAVIYGAIY